MAAPAQEAAAPARPIVRTSGELAEPKDVIQGKRTVFIVAGALGLILFAGGLYFAYSAFFGSEAPAPVAKKSTPAPAAAKTAAAPAPKTATPAPAAPPSTPVGKAKAVTETRAQAVAETAAPVAPAASTPTPSAPPAAAAANAPASPAPAATATPAAAATPKSVTETATARTTIAKGVTATTNLEQAGADASVEFRTFVANAKISGVFQGTPARAVINGRLARSGETVDAALGIVFDRIDADRRHIVFRDRTGATVTRRY
ncbi:MAG: hypothetical protein ACKODK_09615 [Opitutaceae bacterium]